MFIVLSKLLYVGNSNITNNTAKSFDILATSLSVLLSYFDSPNKIIFKSVFS